MSYLEVLKKQNEIRKDYEKKQEDFKLKMTKLIELYSVNNDEFLEKLEEFIKNYKNDKE